MRSVLCLRTNSSLTARPGHRTLSNSSGAPRCNGRVGTKAAGRSLGPRVWHPQTARGHEPTRSIGCSLWKWLEGASR
jgi:hypothetical protein